MVALSIAAFGFPVFWFDDRADPDVSQEALHRLKTQATIGYEIQPLFYQVTDAHMTGPTPDHVEGTVVWRTLFGVPIGQRYDLNVARWIGVWTLFLATELALCIVAFRRLVRDQ